MLLMMCAVTARLIRGICSAVAQIVSIIVQSLLLPETPIPRKLARLYLVSDVLHNSSAAIHNAWRYRMVFEAALPPVFDHLHQVYRSFESRMKAEAFRQQVAAVIAVVRLCPRPLSAIDRRTHSGKPG